MRSFALLLMFGVLLTGVLRAYPPAPPPNPKLAFTAYDGDPRKPETMSFQINRADGVPPRTQFVKLGEFVFGGRLKVAEFRYKTRVDAKSREVDASELVLLDTLTNERTVLVIPAQREAVEKAR